MPGRSCFAVSSGLSVVLFTPCLLFDEWVRSRIVGRCRALLVSWGLSFGSEFLSVFFESPQVRQQSLSGLRRLSGCLPGWAATAGVRLTVLERFFGPPSGGSFWAPREAAAASPGSPAPAPQPPGHLWPGSVAICGRHWLIGGEAGAAQDIP